MYHVFWNWTAAAYSSLYFLHFSNSYPRDGIFNPHLTTIKDSYTNTYIMMVFVVFQELLWIEDSDVFCMVGVLYTDVGVAIYYWALYLYIWCSLYGRQLSKVCCHTIIKTYKKMCIQKRLISACTHLCS